MFTPREVLVRGVRTRYQLYEREAEPRGIILFLHGAGESGSDGVAPTTVGLGPALRRQSERWPAVVVFPQASQGYGWRGFNLAAAIAALDATQAERGALPTYATGISMGGHGTWEIARQLPDRFAALVPVCGGAPRPRVVAERTRRIPQWVFHGEADDVIPAEESRRMVRELEAAGGNVRYTEYPGVRHNSWDRAYAEPALPEWLFLQGR